MAHIVVHHQQIGIIVQVLLIANIFAEIALSLLFFYIKTYKMKQIILLTIVIFALACNSNDKKAEQISVINTNERAILPFSTIFTDYHFVKLETSKECMLGYIDKVIVKKDNFSILSNKAVYNFTKNGTFISKIYKVGKGQGEYINISEFNIDDKGNTIILDALNKKIITYNVDGKFIGEIKNNYLYLAKSFIYLSKNILAIFGDTGWGNEYRLIILDIKNNVVLNKYFFIDHRFRKYQHVFGGSNFFKKDSLVYVAYAFNDTIYKINDKFELEPSFRISHKFPVPKSFYYNDFQDIRDFGNRASKYNYFNSSFLANNQLIYFTFRGEGKKFNRFASFYYFNNDTCYTTNEYIDDLYTGSHLFLNEGFNAKFIKKEKIYYIVEPKNFIDWFGQISNTSLIKENSTILTLKNTTNLNDNPFILVAKLKLFDNDK